MTQRSDNQRPQARPPQRPQAQPAPAYRRGDERPGRFRRQHATPFRYPRGFAYKRWSSGLLLPQIFLGSSYYYDGYAAFGFEAPPRGFRWVRYGPDLLLVNIRTGRIKRVIYRAFY